MNTPTPTTDWVGDRAGCNFCDEFTFVEAEVRGKVDEPKARARGEFGRLFGDDGQEEYGAKKKREDFEKLFGD